MKSGEWLAVIAIGIFLIGMMIAFRASQFEHTKIETLKVRQLTPTTIEKRIVTDRLTDYKIDFTPCEGLSGGVIFLNDLTKTITCGTIKDVDK